MSIVQTNMFVYNVYLFIIIKFKFYARQVLMNQYETPVSR